MLSVVDVRSIRSTLEFVATFVEIGLQFSRFVDSWMTYVLPVGADNLKANPLEIAPSNPLIDRMLDVLGSFVVPVSATAARSQALDWVSVHDIGVLLPPAAAR